jgi:hypothetical protein
LPTKAADGSWNRRELDSNDELRRQLLGRNYKMVMAEKEKARQKTTDPASKNHVSRGAPGHNQQRLGVGENEDIDNDEGRAASISKNASSRKRKVGGSAEPTTRTEGADSEMKCKDSEEENTASSQGLKAKGRKKATSFLDEILAERSKKRKKR